MVDVNAACFAEVVFGGLSTPSVKAQIIRPLEDTQTFGCGRDCCGPAANAERTIASRSRSQALRKLGFDLDGTTMAGGGHSGHFRGTFGMRDWVSLYLCSGCGG